ncbi:MAG TPA: DUF5996 family protein [Fimbriimonadaceae bacterium]|nr:DUF5996 family protein [Fimbriimonadaceae bacterium]
MVHPQLPPLPLAPWEDTRLFLQLVCQMVGKVRLKTHPPLNHWWHVPLYLSPRGLTTNNVPYGERSFELEVDLHAHCIRLATSWGEPHAILLENRTVASIYRELFATLRDEGIEVRILAKPFDCKSTIPFAQDEEHSRYDPEAVERAWQALAWSDGVFQKFRGRFLGKCSPVHIFWHSFDLAVTRFSGRPGPDVSGADAVTRSAYSHEVISAGFWFGDDNIPEPSYYCYASPVPDGLADLPLPGDAYWKEQRGSPMALLAYDTVRQAERPEETLMEFLEAAYTGPAELAGWPRELAV